MSKKIAIRVDLEDELATSFERVKDGLGLKNNAECIRFLIKDKERELDRDEILKEASVILGEFPEFGVSSPAEFLQKALISSLQELKDNIRQSWQGSWEELNDRFRKIEEKLSKT